MTGSVYSVVAPLILMSCRMYFTLNLAAHLGLDLSQTVAFGDDVNDVSMLRAAGIGVAMGNASPEALQAADRITGTCDEDGVAQALRRLL